MAGQRLTKTEVEAAEPAERDLYLWDQTLSGFGVKVTPAGRRIYIVQYRPKGATAVHSRTRRYTIGRHGAPWTVEKARVAATDLLARVRLGQDPFLSDQETRDKESAQLKARRQAEADAKAAKLRAEREAFELVVADFVERYAKIKNRSHSEAYRILNSADLADWLGKPLSTITRTDVRQVVDTAASRSQGGGRLLFAHLRKFFNWCVENALLEVSPCQGMKGPPSFKARDRWLTDNELRLVWQGCEELGEPFGPLFQLLILTAQRRDEVACMARSELDLAAREWIIPAARAKNAKAHVVDLSPAAMAIIEGRPTYHDLLFTTTGETAVSGFTRAKARLDAIIQTNREAVAVKLGMPLPLAPLPAWRVHDLRRTAATGMARLGCQPFVVEAVLNHISGVRGGLVAVYQHYEHRPERKAALLAWSDHVEKLVAD
jgi:integrase